MIILKNNNPSLNVSYGAPVWNKSVEDFEDIEIFRLDLDQSYTSFVKTIPVERGGGAFELFVEFFANLNAKDYLLPIGTYLLTKASDRIIDPLLDKYIFKPFKDAYQKLQKVNPDLDCYSLTIELLDLKIILYTTSPNSIVENIENVLLAISKHYESMSLKGEYPCEIYLPVFAEFFGEELIYRPPLGEREVIDICKEDNLFKLWGVKYPYSRLSIVFDVANGLILNDSQFMTEVELEYKRKSE